ncbi:MAG: hypothetical protein AB7G54_01895, partial [Methyloceanibacter sp.]
MRLALSLLAAAALLASGSLSLAAEDEPAQSATEPAAPPSASPASPAEAGRQLTPEEKAEKEARKACKKTI